MDVQTGLSEQSDTGISRQDPRTGWQDIDYIRLDHKAPYKPHSLSRTYLHKLILTIMLVMLVHTTTAGAATITSLLLAPPPVVWQCVCILVCFIILVGILSGRCACAGGGPCCCCWRMIKNFRRDWKYFIVFLKVALDIRKSMKADKTVPTLFQDTVSKYPDKSAILFEDQKWTFKDLDNYSNRVARLLMSNGFKKGECIALVMANCPQYVGILLGASKIGVEVALINYNLRGQGLLHCISIAECSGVIYEHMLEEAITDIYTDLNERVRSMCYCCLGESSTNGNLFDSAILKQSDKPLQLNLHVTSKDVYCYIYTSGTTGLPKAVPIRHYRAVSVVLMFGRIVPIESDDIVYTVLPLYHSNGSLLCAGLCCCQGSSIVLKKKFSARQFISDCIKYKCTAFCYIGELCRYLLLQPPKVTDTQHSIVKCFGNGLRQEVWEEFQKRFSVARVLEFYGSTEGNCRHFNLIGKPGSIGYIPVWLKYIYKIYYVKVDPITGDLVRDGNGFCIEASTGEKGEMIRAIGRYSKVDGYKDKAATSKKILTDVFKKGDYYFRSGDIVSVDEDGFVYFCDRAGDTFRWKGENVSTTEVENTINSCIGQTDVVVYGVEVPNTDGRAGMAAIVGTEESIGITDQKLADQLKKALPSYAVPIFIRLIDNTRITGTFKFQKVDYRKEGFDLEKVGKDQLFVLDPSLKKYVSLTQEKYDMICNGEIKL